MWTIPKLYTELPVAECDRLGALAGSEINDSKVILANEVTALLHGAEAAKAAEATAREVFEKGGVGDDLPTLTLSHDDIGDEGFNRAIDREIGPCEIRKEAKRLIAENGAKLNDEPLTDGG